MGLDGLRFSLSINCILTVFECIVIHFVTPIVIVCVVAFYKVLLAI